MCLTLNSIVSSLLRRKKQSRSSQCATRVTSARDDDDDNNDDDSDDEWGIVHRANVPPRRVFLESSRLQMETACRGVRVSLVLVVTWPPSHVPFRLRLQQTRATWTFEAAAATMCSPYNTCRFVQKPMSDVGFVTSSLLDAYVSDRLERAARRHFEWTTGSRLGSTFSPLPHKVTSAHAHAAAITRKRVTHSTASTGTKASEPLSATAAEVSTRHDPSQTGNCKDTERHRHVAQAKRPTGRLRTPRRRPLHKTASRYLLYKNTTAYLRRRTENLRRARALGSSRQRQDKTGGYML
ncbi:unnamed protein product [Hyaloperonospora brassicae]|uniref:Uncharacterized protein n=1 Tax=Hyaloperonospora brassicae TaxID=162125 RepID=A0AAV0TKP5_HYABA|nr:unnamed protein product [Hyaloperonospora brassicae]